MAFKINGAKFNTMEELKASLWELYKDKMSKEEFDKFVEKTAEKVD